MEFQETSISDSLPDIQHTMKPAIKTKLRQVGVENVKVPILLDSMFGKTHEVVANIDMGTNLSEEYKGISMSKLTRTLMNYMDKPIKKKVLKEILQLFKTEVETESTESYMRASFKLPISIKSPKSGFVFPQYYDCSFEGKLINDVFSFYEKVRVQYSSYCPCSAALCEDLRSKGSNGFPHAQRCYADVLVNVTDEAILWLEEIIMVVRDAVQTVPYPVIRRMDEQEVARIAAKNPMFVEDAIRRISASLDRETKIKDWIVKCTHEESIHTSNAVAVNWKGIPCGFDERYYL